MFIVNRLQLKWKAVMILLSMFICSQAVNADPMRPPAFGVVSTKKTFKSTSYNVSQVLISSERKRAVINERVVMVGDSISGARVLAIKPNQVVLKVDGKKQVLAVNPAKGFKIKREAE